MTRRIVVATLLIALATAPPVPVESEEVLGRRWAVDLSKAKPLFDSRSWHARLQAQRNLADLAHKAAPSFGPPAAFGFAAQSEQAKFFLIGTFYAEALAYLGGGDESAAAERLQSIEDELIVLNVPGSLFNYVDKTQNLIKTEHHSPAALLDMLSLFQPLFEDFARGRGEDEVVLFQAGAWLFDLGLGASAEDSDLVSQRWALTYFRGQMRRMDAPAGVITSLDQIASIVETDPLTQKESAAVLKLVRRIQGLLG
jgi:hypothetical protein